MLLMQMSVLCLKLITSRSKSRDHKSKKSKKSKRGSEERDTKDKKISRDYDAEEKGYENGKDEKGPVDMEISNSP